jgi:hypothetical protein
VDEREQEGMIMDEHGKNTNGDKEPALEDVLRAFVKVKKPTKNQVVKSAQAARKRKKSTK